MLCSFWCLAMTEPNSDGQLELTEPAVVTERAAVASNPNEVAISIMPSASIEPEPYAISLPIPSEAPANEPHPEKNELVVPILGNGAASSSSSDSNSARSLHPMRAITVQPFVLHGALRVRPCTSAPSCHRFRAIASARCWRALHVSRRAQVCTLLAASLKSSLCCACERSQRAERERGVQGVARAERQRAHVAPLSKAGPALDCGHGQPERQREEGVPARAPPTC